MDGLRLADLAHHFVRRYELFHGAKQLGRRGLADQETVRLHEKNDRQRSDHAADGDRRYAIELGDPQRVREKDAKKREREPHEVGDVLEHDAEERWILALPDRRPVAASVRTLGEPSK